MNVFLKIGLPWGISLGVVFFLGLYLGSEQMKDAFASADLTRPVSSQPQNSTESRKDILSAPQASDRNTIKHLLENKNPEMPPNLQRIMQGGDMVESLGSYLDAVRSMDRSNVKHVIKAFEELPSGYGRHLEMKLLMRSWVNFDPESALSYALNKLDARSERKFGISEALAGWAVKDQEAAIAWAEAHNPTPKREENPLLVGIIKGLMETDLDAANRLFHSLPQGNSRWQASGLLAEKYANSGTNQAIQWASQYPTNDPRMRESILAQVGARLAQTDLETTADWVQNLPDEPGALRVLENVIDQWTRKDPQETASWVDSLSMPSKKRHAMNELTHKWSLIDPIATAEWLNTIPPSTQNDAAIATFVSNIKDQDPEGAIDWAQSISDPEQRQKYVQQALESWKRTNAEKAEHWLKENQKN
jgi:hypothetical protein